MPERGPQFDGLPGDIWAEERILPARDLSDIGETIARRFRQRPPWNTGDYTMVSKDPDDGLGDLVSRPRDKRMAHLPSWSPLAPGRYGQN